MALQRTCSGVKIPMWVQFQHILTVLDSYNMTECFTSLITDIFTWYISKKHIYIYSIYLYLFYIYKIESLSVYLYVCLLLGDGIIFFGVSSFWSITRQCLNNEVMHSFVGSVARQWPLSNNGLVFSLGSILRTHCHRKSIDTTPIAKGLSS
jgi:hypothetical protein